MDYVLYRPHRDNQPLREVSAGGGGAAGGSRRTPPQHPLLSPQEVEGISFITQLASRSDHLPVALRLAVSPTAP